MDIQRTNFAKKQWIENRIIEPEREQFLYTMTSREKCCLHNGANKKLPTNSLKSTQPKGTGQG